MDVQIIPALADNFTYLLSDGADAVVIDPSEAAPVQAVLRARGLKLRDILVTHNHQDHIGGVAELVRAGGVRLWAPSSRGLPPVHHLTVDGDGLALAGATLQVIATPGHLQEHVAYYDPEHQWLFCGDTLFLCGCGRVIGSCAGTLWESLCKLMALPDGVQVYCGHDYTLDNMAFGLSVLPGDTALTGRRADWVRRRADGWPGVPGSMGEEKRTNIFLRADQDAVRMAVGLPEPSPASVVFAELRRRKDRWG